MNCLATYRCDWDIANLVEDDPISETRGESSALEVAADRVVGYS
jgi:hypothetical protein